MIPSRCSKCNKAFAASNVRQKYCYDCRNKRSHHGDTTTRFIGIDGEGVNRPDGNHEYVLLSVGSKSLYKPDGSRLTWYDIMPFLWDCFLDDPNAAYVGFYLGYDFTHWLRDLPENRARMLLTNEGIAQRKRTQSGGNHLPFPVEHRGWYFDMLGMKRMRLWRENSELRMYICDTGAYFQTSFLNAVDPDKWPDGPVLSEDEFKLITIGKSERGVDAVDYGSPITPEMIEYNITENRVLGRLMARYRDGLADVGIHLKRDQWFGPGQAAQTWMNNIHAPRREEYEKVTPIQIRNILRSTYYGGWFEIFAHGHIPGRSYSYDINSAYPDIQSNLPCCLHGKWEMGKGTPPSSAYLGVYGTFYGQSEGRIGVAPYRVRTGNILRPITVKGWYWWHEIEAARQAKLIDSVDIERWIRYIPCDCLPPFRAERALYEDRLRVGKNTMGGKARKLVYNSAYGKTAQSIGAAKYANALYASLITSFCRTYILNAIATHPIGANDVLMVATDGITFRHRHRTLHLDETALGHWSESRNENLTLFMPGVYWDDATRIKLRNGDSPTLKSRGIPSRNLAMQISHIDDLFNQPYSGFGFPSFDLPINFSLVTPKLALARNKWNTCGAVNLAGIRTINSDPRLKRNPQVFEEDGLIRSIAYSEGFTGIETTPYDRTFGDETLSELMRELMTQDGELTMLLAQALESNG